MALLIDDLLLFPFKAICESVRDAARQDMENRQREITDELTRLHVRLESGEVDEEQFDRQETALLDRFDRIQKTLHPEPKPSRRERLEKYFSETDEPDFGNGGTP
ncbi:MAG: gas vesicle protein GvpG [Planctomycetia bacterium]|nr:gas vesicle protein GvpG [Planctomycetia bacterium]